MNNEPVNTPLEQIEQPIVQPLENTQEHDQPKKQESRKGLFTKMGIAVAAIGALVSPGHNSQSAPQPEANEASVSQPATDLLNTNTVESMPASEPVHGELGNPQQLDYPESLPSAPDYTAESPEFTPPVMPPFTEMLPSFPDQQPVAQPADTPVGSTARQEAIVSTPFSNSEVIKQMVDTSTNSTNTSKPDTITRVE